MILERFADLGLIEPIGSMLRTSDLTRVVQIMRLRRDLGLNLMGAAIALDLVAEIAQLKAQIQALPNVSEKAPVFKAGDDSERSVQLRHF